MGVGVRFESKGKDEADIFVKSPKAVTPVKTGVQNLSKQSRETRDFRRNDDKGTATTFCETINI